MFTDGAGVQHQLNLPGAQGNDGADSTVPGPQGYQGDTGDQGNQGYQGHDSTNDWSDVTGSQGVWNATSGENIQLRTGTDNIVVNIPQYVEPNTLPITIVNRRTTGVASVKALGSTGFGIYLEGVLYAQGEYIRIPYGAGITFVPFYSFASNTSWNGYWHGEGGYRTTPGSFHDYGTKTADFDHYVDRYNDAYVAIGAQGVQINLTQEDGSPGVQQQQLVYDGSIWVHMNGNYALTTCTIGGTNTEEVVKGTPPSTSGENAMLVYKVYLDNGTDRFWAEWVNDA